MSKHRGDPLYLVIRCHAGIIGFEMFTDFSPLRVNIKHILIIRKIRPHELYPSLYQLKELFSVNGYITCRGNQRILFDLQLSSLANPHEIHSL